MFTSGAVKSPKNYRFSQVNKKPNISRNCIALLEIFLVFSIRTCSNWGFRNVAFLRTLCNCFAVRYRTELFFGVLGFQISGWALINEVFLFIWKFRCGPRTCYNRVIRKWWLDWQASEMKSLWHYLVWHLVLILSLTTEISYSSKFREALSPLSTLFEKG